VPHLVDGCILWPRIQCLCRNLVKLGSTVISVRRRGFCIEATAGEDCEVHTNPLPRNTVETSSRIHPINFALERGPV
jgi:hypothetical protein